MSCITKLLEQKGDREFMPSPLISQVIIEGGGVYKGYEYLIVLNRSAHRCGYVAIPKEHIKYDDPEGYPDYDVHGGITFFGKPHLVETTCEDKWLGFDAGHYCDGYDVDAMEKYFGSEEGLVKFMRSSNHYNDCEKEIKYFGYMESECKRLIDQLEAA